MNLMYLFVGFIGPWRNSAELANIFHFLWLLSQFHLAVDYHEKYECVAHESPVCPSRLDMFSQQNCKNKRGAGNGWYFPKHLL